MRCCCLQILHTDRKQTLLDLSLYIWTELTKPLLTFPCAYISYNTPPLFYDEVISLTKYENKVQQRSQTRSCTDSNGRISGRRETKGRNAKQIPLFTQAAQPYGVCERILLHDVHKLGGN